MKKKRLHLSVFVLLLFLLLVGASFVLARELEVDYPKLPGTEVVPRTVEGTALPDYVKYIFNFAIALVGLIAFVSVVIGGIRWYSSAGDARKLTEAKNQLLAAFLGTIILLSSYFVLTTINPQLIIFEVSGLKPIDISPVSQGPSLERITSSINAELPLGTIIEDGVFNESRMNRIKSLAEKTEIAGKESLETNEEMSSLTKACSCSGGDVKPCGCEGGCELIEVSVPCPEEEEPPGETPPGEEDSGGGDGFDWGGWDDFFWFLKAPSISAAGDCVEYYCENVDCRCPACESDPCSNVRGGIDESLTENQKNIEKLLVLQKETQKELADLREEVRKMERTIEFMSSCPVWNLTSLAEFTTLKDYYSERDWDLKSIRYWQDINPGRNPLTFYCPIGGTSDEYLPGEEISQEELERMSKDFEEYLKESGGYQTTVSCSKTIPLGEILDRTLALSHKLTGEMENLLRQNEEMINAVNSLETSVSECTSLNCSCSCTCGSPMSCPCELASDSCFGQPCPDGKIKENLSNIEKIKNEMSETKEKIDNIVGKERAELLLELAKVKEPVPVCTTEDFESPNLLLLDCRRAIGNIGPGGKIIENEEDCYCKSSESCSDEYEILKDYNCRTLDDCNQYNFFCCRSKD